MFAFTSLFSTWPRMIWIWKIQPLYFQSVSCVVFSIFFIQFSTVTSSSYPNLMWTTLSLTSSVRIRFTNLFRCGMGGSKLEEDLARRNHMYQKTTRILVFKLRGTESWNVNTSIFGICSFTKGYVCYSISNWNVDYSAFLTLQFVVASCSEALPVNDCNVAQRNKWRLVVQERKQNKRRRTMRNSKNFGRPLSGWKPLKLQIIRWNLTLQVFTTWMISLVLYYSLSAICTQLTSLLTHLFF